MVAHLATLKLTLLRNSLRRDPWQVVALVLGVLWAGGVALLAVVGLVALRGVDTDDAGTVVTLGGAVLLVGWAVVPVIAFGTDSTLDPARFVTFPLRRRDVLPGMLAAGVIGLPGAATVLVSLGTVVTWSRSFATVVVAVVCAVLAVATCVAASRATTTAAAGLLASRRTRELGASLILLLAVASGPVFSSFGRSLGELGGARRAAEVVGWTPPGWVWSAPWDAARGDLGTAALKLLLACALLGALLWWWAAALDRALVSPPSSASSSVRGGGTLERWATSPTSAVVVRCLRYWRRDPRYLTSLIATLALPLVLVGLVVSGAVSSGTAALMVAPAIGGLLGWGLHNDVAYDGTAVWSHVAAGLAGTADRWGRAVAVLAWGLPLVVVASVGGVAVADRWDMLPGVLGCAVGLLGAGLGVSAVASAVYPYPVPEPGANPFSTPPGSGVRTMVGQMATSTATVLLSLPAGVVFVLALVNDSAALSWTALLLGLGVGGVALAVGARVGGRLFERRGPELLLALRR